MHWLVLVCSVGILFSACRSTQADLASQADPKLGDDTPSSKNGVIATCNNLGSESYQNGQLIKGFYPNYRMEILGTSQNDLTTAVLIEEPKGIKQSFDLKNLKKQDSGPYRLSNEELTLEFSDLPAEANTYWWVTVLGVSVEGEAFVKTADNSAQTKANHDAVRILCFKGQ